MPAAPFPPFEQDRLHALLSMGLLDSPGSATFDNFVAIASKLMDMPIAAISLVAGNRQCFKAIQGLPGVTETPREVAFCAYTILDPHSNFVVPDAWVEPKVADNKLVTAGPRIRSYAGAPLLADGGLPIGALCVIDTKPRTFRSEDLSRLSELARMVSKSLKLHAAVHAMRSKGR